MHSSLEQGLDLIDGHVWHVLPKEAHLRGSGVRQLSVAPLEGLDESEGCAGIPCREPGGVG